MHLVKGVKNILKVFGSDAGVIDYKMKVCIMITNLKMDLALVRVLNGVFAQIHQLLAKSAFIGCYCNKAQSFRSRTCLHDIGNTLQ